MGLSPKLWRALLVVTVLLALGVAFVSANRAWRTYLLLNAAQTSGELQTSGLRGWMTIGQIAGDYRLPEPAFLSALDLAAETNRNLSLYDLANRRGRSIFSVVQEVQGVIVTLRKLSPATETAAVEAGWFRRSQDAVIQFVVVHGTPALGLTLLLGSIGLPLPTGLATSVAGAVASREGLDWIAIIAIVGAAVAGDSVAYAVGRAVNPSFVLRHGRKFGYTQNNRARIETLFARWGIVTVLMTRTLASHLSSVASVLAGFHRYSVSLFLFYSVIGRALWTSAYFGLGYAVGTDLESATGFLGSLATMIVALAVAGWALYSLMKSPALSAGA